MTIKELMNLDISRLTSKTIQEIGHYAQVQVNKQARRWEKSEFKSPAFYALEKSGGKISFKGKTLNEKKKELARAVKFLSDPTRTQKGWKNVKEEITSDVKEKYNLDVSPGNYDKLWTAYEKAKEINGTIGQTEYKYLVIQALNEIISENPGMDADELAILITSDMESRIAEREEKIEQERSNISSNFK